MTENSSHPWSNDLTVFSPLDKIVILRLCPLIIGKKSIEPGKKTMNLLWFKLIREEKEYPSIKIAEVEIIISAKVLSIVGSKIRVGDENNIHASLEPEMIEIVVRVMIGLTSTASPSHRIENELDREFWTKVRYTRRTE